VEFELAVDDPLRPDVTELLERHLAFARDLYTAIGFVPCAPFGDYTDNPHSICMTLSVV